MTQEQSNDLLKLILAQPAWSHIPVTELMKASFFATVRIYDFDLFEEALWDTIRQPGRSFPPAAGEIIQVYNSRLRAREIRNGNKTINQLVCDMSAEGRQKTIEQIEKIKREHPFYRNL